MPCFFRSASAIASAIFTLPLPILPVGGVNLAVVLPSVSVTSLPLRRPSTSDFEFASEPAKSEFSFTSWSRFSDQATSGASSSAINNMVLFMDTSYANKKHRRSVLHANGELRSDVNFFRRRSATELLLAQRFEEGDEIVDLLRREMQLAQHLLAVEMQAIL